MLHQYKFLYSTRGQFNFYLDRYLPEIRLFGGKWEQTGKYQGIKKQKKLVLCYLQLLFSEQWPASNPLPNYEIIFADGCVPSSLHNISDRPAYFPTLDTLPRDRRPLDYSDAYDSGSNEEKTSNLRVNPMVEAAVANTASMVHSQSVPPKLATTWEAQHPTVSLLIV